MEILLFNKEEWWWKADAVIRCFEMVAGTSLGIGPPVVGKKYEQVQLPPCTI